MVKAEYDEKKEELKRHFREFCYQMQKCYHSTTEGTLLLDKDFQGLNRNKDYISAKSKISGLDFLDLTIDLCQDNITINLVSPPDGDYQKLEKLKGFLTNRKEAFTKFFKENKQVFIVLYRVEYKKSGEGSWIEEFKFTNNELSLGDFKVLIDNMEKLQPSPYNIKKSAGIHIRAQISKSDIIRMGKTLPSRVCTEVIRFLSFCDALK
jgi:hypothetical protein